jgi:hypothetical protein
MRQWQTLKISDLCIIVLAMGLGARLSLLRVTTVGWPFSQFVVRALTLGGLILCPLVLFKQFIFERRRVVPMFGESLWLVSFLWITFVASFVLLGSTGGSILLYVVVGALAHHITFACACIYLVKMLQNRRTAFVVWSDLLGCIISAVFSAIFILHIWLVPIDL